MASSDRFFAVCVEEILYSISNIFAKSQVFYYLVSDTKIFDIIIYQLSPLLECDPTVCLPSGDLTFLWETNRRVTLQQGSKLYNIIYSYKYLESDLIKHCHVIFIHSLGQPLIVRSHSKVHRSRGNPKEIPT